MTLCITFEPSAKKTLNDISLIEHQVNLIIGPEGGLSTKEIFTVNKKKNFHSVKFAPRILRTETAAISAITAIQILWGDLL